MMSVFYLLFIQLLLLSNQLLCDMITEFFVCAIIKKKDIFLIKLYLLLNYSIIDNRCFFGGGRKKIQHQLFATLFMIMFQLLLLPIVCCRLHSFNF